MLREEQAPCTESRNQRRFTGDRIIGEDVKPMRRCEEKRKEWARHWECDSEAQAVHDNQWRNEELRSLK